MNNSIGQYLEQHKVRNAVDRRT